jgi:hypothetical protein
MAFFPDQLCVYRYFERKMRHTTLSQDSFTDAIGV